MSWLVWHGQVGCLACKNSLEDTRSKKTAGNKRLEAVLWINARRTDSQSELFVENTRIFPSVGVQPIESAVS
jgi:hypothetical protein